MVDSTRLGDRGTAEENGGRERVRDENRGEALEGGKGKGITPKVER